MIEYPYTVKELKREIIRLESIIREASIYLAAAGAHWSAAWARNSIEKREP